MDIINGKIFTMEDEIIENGFITIQNGKILKYGDMSKYVKTSNEIIEAYGQIVMPGFVDAHTHMGIFEEGISVEGDDGNEDTDPVTPQLRAIDGINTFDISFKDALKNGITTVVVSPGSANVIGGQMAILKTAGTRIDDMIIKEPFAMKISLGENPKSIYSGKNQTPATRMAIASLIRESLKKAKEYYEEKQNIEADDECDDTLEFDFKCESLIPVITGEIPVHFHAHRADDIYSAMRIAKEFNLDYVIVHATEGVKIADDLLKDNVKVIVGPVLTDRSKPELRELSAKSAGDLAKKGILVSLSTDHPETPIKYLNICGGISVKNGMDYWECLKSLTINGAKICGVDDRVGSIKVGKDADIIFLNGDPLSIYTDVTLVMVNGIIQKF